MLWNSPFTANEHSSHLLPWRARLSQEFSPGQSEPFHQWKPHPGQEGALGALPSEYWVCLLLDYRLQWSGHQVSKWTWEEKSARASIPSRPQFPLSQGTSFCIFTSATQTLFKFPVWKVLKCYKICSCLKFIIGSQKF